jgi:hypothetical protein
MAREHMDVKELRDCLVAFDDDVQVLVAPAISAKR